jgi:hypothetical protein
MSIRRGQGKVRPELPRRRELHVVAAAPEAKEGRDASGKFAPGNGVARDRGWRTALGRVLGHELTDASMRRVANDSWRLHGAIVKELPSDGVIVRGIVVTLAMHTACMGYWSALALDLGLSTAEGQAASERARIHGTRVERLSVTALDLASKLAACERPGTHDAALQAGLQRLEEHRRREEAENANAPPEGARGQDEGITEADGVCTVCGRAWPAGSDRCLCGEGLN